MRWWLVTSGFGPAPADQTHLCGYVDAAASPICGEPAVLHLLVRSRDDGAPQGHATCTIHFPLAAATGALLGFHDFAGWCGMLGAGWDREHNECVLDPHRVEPLVGAPAASEAELTQRYVTAVEAQRGAVATYTKAVAYGIAAGQRPLTVRHTYQQILEGMCQDPVTYTAVLLAALVALAEHDS